jgi:hypothetical protein
LVCAVGKKLDISTTATEPSLLIALSAGEITTSGVKSKAQKLRLVMGQEKWVAVNQQEQLENSGKVPVEMLRFDFKTRPLSKEELEKNKKHEHSKN